MLGRFGNSAYDDPFVGYLHGRRLAVCARILAGQSSRQRTRRNSYIDETSGRPAAYSYLEVVYPLQKDKVIIGTSYWEFKLGTGLIRGFTWGTMSARIAVEYDDGEQTFGLGEIAVDYLKRRRPSTGLAPATPFNLVNSLTRY